MHDLTEIQDSLDHISVPKWKFPLTEEEIRYYKQFPLPVITLLQQTRVSIFEYQAKKDRWRNLRLAIAVAILVGFLIGTAAKVFYS